jgi:hypothetical protein
VVILGTPNAESSKLYAMTVTEGDPTWAGPLAGEALGLPVFHVTESEVKGQVEDSVYEAEIGVAEMVLDVDAIGEAVHEIRSNNNGS